MEYDNDSIIVDTYHIRVSKARPKKGDKTREVICKSTTPRCSEKEKENFFKESILLYAFKSSPELITVLDIFKFGDRYFTFMEYMDGGGLNDILRERY